MKKILLFALMLTFAGSHVQAQTAKEIAKKMNGRSIIDKASRKAADKKIAKTVKKQVKQWKKEGWKTMPGQLTLEQQMQRSVTYQEQYEDDNALMPKYVWGDASSEAQVYDAGKAQALELAQLNLAGNIESRVAQIIENNVGNDQTSSEQVTSLVKTLKRAKRHVQANLGQTIPVIEVYRELKNGNVQVRVQAFYSMDQARRVAREAIRKQMEEEGKQMAPELDKLIKE